MKKLFTLLSIALFFVSCSSDNDGSTTQQVVLLTKTITTYEDAETYTINYSYNDNKLIEATHIDSYSPASEFSSIVTYTGDLITKMQGFYNNVLGQESHYVYDNNNRLINYREVDYNSSGTHIEEFEYVYNSNGTVSFEQYNGNSEDSLVLLNTGIFTFNNFGEVISIIFSDGYTESYIYDNKNSPYKNVLGYDKIPFEGNNPTPFLHNITNKVTTNSNNSYVYTYNSNNFPLTKAEDNEINNTQYFYND